MDDGCPHQGESMSTPLLGALVAFAIVIVTLLVSYFG
jgi:hypothetical protein